MLLHHSDLGGAGHSPLLVLHGLLGSSRNWQTAGRDLAARYHVLAPDARNHGRSPHDPDMSYAAMAADVIALMDAQGIASATLIGHSMGGKTAMRLACRHPERVTRLVVVDIAPKDNNWGANRDEFAAMRELDLGTLQSRLDAENRFASRVASVGMRKFLATNLERDEAGRWRWLVNLPVLDGALRQLEHSSLAPEDRFDGPTLFIAGERSRFIQPEDHDVIRRHFPVARIEVIAGAGHNPHIDTRERFVRLVAAN